LHCVPERDFPNDHAPPGALRAVRGPAEDDTLEFVVLQCMTDEVRHRREI
jgi:hypothetical protein